VGSAPVRPHKRWPRVRLCQTRDRSEPLSIRKPLEIQTEPAPNLRSPVTGQHQMAPCLTANT
jgi:hypothetical protein